MLRIGAVWASIGASFMTVPLATVTAWRTWVHATRWQTQHRTWWGVAEGGGVGALSVTLMLLPGVLAAAIRGVLGGLVAIIFYAAIGGLVGLALGLLLQLTAIAVLEMVSRGSR
jgi:hypothetical protein